NRLTVLEASSAAPAPTRLRIPSLQIDAPVISVGQTASGAMDAPTSKALHSPYWTSVFWYNEGPVPGQEGNAVIAGHVDRVGGDPAIFWSLDTLVPGDRISVLNAQSKTLQFVVNRVVKYPANAPSQDVINAVFGPASGHHLNLITCSGVWTGNGYDQRLVVFTTQVQ
ncbi:MAG TPA: class F sortase, partial [Ktedonobacteraceae bacterium]|nr:class F sortase [Ktedonobacteraceae bacterium]